LAYLLRIGGSDMIKSFDELIQRVKGCPTKKVAIPGADTESAIQAAISAKRENIADFLLIGNKNNILSLIESIDKEMRDSFEIIDESDLDSAVQKAVDAIHKGKADLILKGKTSTSQLMKGCLDKDRGLQTGRLLSDVFVFETDERLTLMSDGGIVLYPDLQQKVAIVENAVAVAHHLENPNPKVAILSAVETPNLKMPSTLDAALLAQMNKRGQIKGCIVDGPFALDNAVSKKAAKIKGIESPVAGDADVLIVPSIEAGNIFGKTLTYYAHLRVAHVVMGAKAPILITSRADTAEVKLHSIALGIICAETRK
jgi:phosphate butyryltransferase